jgi:regulator of replication initiation timing
VVDKLNETIAKQFEDMKEELQVLKQLRTDYTSLRTELDTLKERFAESGNEINEMIAKTGKKAMAKKKPATAKKLAVKKKTTKK